MEQKLIDLFLNHLIFLFIGLMWAWVVLFDDNFWWRAFALLIMGCIGFFYGNSRIITSQIKDAEENLAFLRSLNDLASSNTPPPAPYMDSRIVPLLKKASSTDSGAERDAAYDKAAELWKKEMIQIYESGMHSVH